MKPENAENDSNLEDHLPEAFDQGSPLADGLDFEISHQIFLDRYSKEWSSLANEPDVEKLIARSQDGGLRASRFRSIYWRIYLNLLGRDSSKWPSEIASQRRLYSQLQEELESSPWTENNSDDNPLSQERESVWCRYFRDEELRSLIRQDVIRTFPGIDFFQNQEIQASMIKILFLYARKNPSLCYRQGMHEILAPILFVLHCDEEAFAHADEMGPQCEDLYVIYDEDFIAHDAFAIFSMVMSNVESSYAIKNSSPASRLSAKSDQDNEVVWRLDTIRDKLLTPVDPQLSRYLQALDIPLQIFGIRWLRLLFGREFPLQDLLMLWDVIFTSKAFAIVDYIVVAMLIAIRHLLLNRDYTTCLSNVMHYPAGVDVSYILQHAHHLENPQRYPAPPQPPTCTPAPDRRRGNRSSKTTSRGWLGSPPSLNDSVPNGYLLEDPECLRLDLEHARSIMALCRIKIQQYRAILEPVVISSEKPDCIQALEGLHELCNMLKDSPETPPKFAEVECADEVIPSPLTPRRPTTQSPVRLTPRRHVPELEVYKHTLNDGPIDGAPMIDPLHRESVDYHHDAIDHCQFYKEFNQPDCK